MVRKISNSFYKCDAETLASALIGTTLVHRRRGRAYRARIVETEAYIGPHDVASHSSKGRTKRTEVMFGPAGRAYVYLIYGMYEMFNIVAGETGSGQAVLIRAADPLDDWDADLRPGQTHTRARNLPFHERLGPDWEQTVSRAGSSIPTADQEGEKNWRRVCRGMEAQNAPLF